MYMKQIYIYVFCSLKIACNTDFYQQNYLALLNENIEFITKKEVKNQVNKTYFGIIA